jgi:hypothetical protein
MPIKKVTHREKMTKKGSSSVATKWVPSSFEESDLKKAKKKGLLSESAPIIFPGDERIPKPPSGYRVMFLDFLLRGLSLPAHEFLRGLLFVYSMQLHQLMPNSILHIACFINLCESFLRIDPHWVLWKFLFRLRPSILLAKNPELRIDPHWALSRTILNSTWMSQFKAGGRSGSISRTKRLCPLTSLVSLPLMPAKPDETDIVGFSSYRS